jgi:peptide deformylase
MAKLTILHYPDPNLRKIAVPVANIDQDIKSLAADMLETMYAEKGIGLAATQVNVQKRLIVMDLTEDKNQPMVMINPVIVAKSGIEEMQEGCLSVPGYYEIIQRAEQINCQYLDPDGKSLELETNGLMAVCIQHEIDHLDGKLFIDYLSSLKREMIRKKIQKQDRISQQVL